MNSPVVEKLRSATEIATPSDGSWFILSLVMTELGLAALAISPYVRAGSWWFHGAWCVLAFFAMVPFLVYSLRLGPAVILLDHRLVFAVAFLAYFVFGASLPAFGPVGTVQHVLRYYAVAADDALRIDALNSIGFGIAIFVATVSRGRFLGGMASRITSVMGRIPNYVTVLLFASVGLLASYPVMLVDFGLQQGIVAGTWRSAASLVLMAIFLGASDRGQYRHSLTVLAVILAAAEIATGLLLLNKTAALLPMVALVLGVSLRHRSMKVLAVGAVIAVVFLGSLGGVVAQARNVLSHATSVGIATHWEALDSGFQNVYIDDYADDSPLWARLCYLAPQNAARELYEAGRGGDSVKLIPWLFIPRVIAPEKPVISVAGRQLHEAMTGNSLSATSPGVFIEGYYNAGWLGWALFSVVCGWILAQTSAMALVILRDGDMILVPLAFSGVMIAFRIDGHFVSGYLGSFVLVLYVLLAGTFTASTSAPRRRFQ